MPAEHSVVVDFAAFTLIAHRQPFPQTSGLAARRGGFDVVILRLLGAFLKAFFPQPSSAWRDILDAQAGRTLDPAHAIVPTVPRPVV